MRVFVGIVQQGVDPFYKPVGDHVFQILRLLVNLVPPIPHDLAQE